MIRGEGGELLAAYSPGKVPNAPHDQEWLLVLTGIPVVFSRPFVAPSDGSDRGLA